MRSNLALAALIITALALGGSLAIAIWDANEQEALGKVHFPISCSAAGQRQFDLATARLHSLRFNESERIYAAIAEAEPDCAIAYWGIAMSRLKRPVAGFRAPEDIRVAREVLRSAANARVATPRERAYIDALALLFEGDSPTDWPDRTMAYEQAMGTLATVERKDREATIFYALALNLAALSSNKSFERQAKAAELLLGVFGEQPHHPGLWHYLTYCLRSPAEEPPELLETPQSRLVSSLQNGLAALALIGVGAFFVAVLPVWSRAKGA